MTIKDSLLLSVPIVKRFSAENFLSSAKTGPQNSGFSRKWGSNHSILVSRPPKGTSLHGTTSFDVFFCVTINVAVASLKNKKKRNNRPNRTWSDISRIWGEKNPGPIWSKFCSGGDVLDVIISAKFGDDRLRDFSVARRQILGFSIGFRRRPYNTLALPCE